MKFFLANWKMHKTIGEALEFIDEFIPLVKDVSNKEIALAPTFLCLEKVHEALKGTNIKLCAQNVFYEKQGAYTGEISPLMLKDVGVDYVIVGHSERRKYFQENDEIINKKIKACNENGLKVIICIGETLEERQKNRTFEILKKQIIRGLEGISNFNNITIAYEPVWAIGTGIVANELQIKEAHLFIKEQLKEFAPKNSIRILYGGSVTADNIKKIMNIENVDGVLVGGASLNPVNFAKIIKYED